MRFHRPAHALAASAALTFLTVPLAAPAFAQGDDPSPTSPAPRAVDLEAVRDRCRAAIDRRLTTLDELGAKVTAAERLSDEQEVELQATIAQARAGLSARRAEIDGDTDLGELRTDCRRIVADHRVYVLLAPQVRLIIGADSAQTAVGALERAVPKLQAAIDTAAAAGTDVTAANGLLDSVEAATADAERRSAEVLAAVSPLTPADYNSGSAALVLRGARTDLATVATDLATARADAKRIRELLR